MLIFQRKLFGVDRCGLERCLYTDRADMALGQMLKNVPKIYCTSVGSEFTDRLAMCLLQSAKLPLIM